MDAASTASTTSASVDGRSVGGSSSDFLNLGMFNNNNTQQTGDVLVGSAASAFGSTLGNGFANDSSTAGVATSSSSGTSFDLSDFPSLGGSGSTAGTGNGLAAALRQQQQLLAHQQMLQGSGSKGSNMYRLAMTGGNGNFNMATEDFPALSGAPPTSASSTNATSNGSLNSSSLLAGSNAASISRTPSNGGAAGLYAEVESGNAHLEGGAGLLGSTAAGLAGLGGLRGLQQTNANPTLTRAPTSASTGPSSGAIGSSSTSSSGAAAGSAVGTALQGDYGLLGLLGVIRMTDADRNALALGSDLTLLGLNLGTTEQIYSTFSSPWSETQPTKEPHYQLPSCYYMQPPALKTGHLSKFQLETLFYIFYALPKDVLQAYAAQELYSREWRYHGELKLWFKRAGPSDGLTNATSGTSQFLYFDINSWERRLFNGSMNQSITNGFLQEEEVRVKFPNS